MSDRLRCTNCGYELLINAEWLKNLRIKFSSSISGLVIENIETYLPRFKCSKCSAKAARIIKSKSLIERFPVIERLPVKQSEPREPNYIEWGTKTNFPSMDISANQSGQEKNKSTKWSKKTCPACNGDGLGGHCYKCDGTGWVEASF